MTGTFQRNWQYTWADVWSPLVDEPYPDEVEIPNDLFIELYKIAVDYFSNEPNSESYEQIVNDPLKASEAFKAIQGTDFKSESAIVLFLEEARLTLEEMEMSGIAARYAQLIGEFIERYNLRYELIYPFHLRLMLPGAFAGLYQELDQMSDLNPSLATLMNYFELSFDNYARSQTPFDLSVCIHQAANYAEGIASSTTGSKSSLGDQCEIVGSWPHGAVKASLKNLYGFTSDYPGIRHGTTTSGKLRELDARDAIVLSVLFIAFNGYLTNGVNAAQILGA